MGAYSEQQINSLCKRMVNNRLWWATGQEVLPLPEEKDCYFPAPRDEREVAP